jgi:RNA polymerase sigma-70 factor (ECF subfamily)
VFDNSTAGWAEGTVVAPDLSGRVDLDDVLARLDDDRRSAFVLTQVLGLQYDEAAEVLDCPVGTIRSRVARARGDLVAMLGDPGADSDEVIAR